MKALYSIITMLAMIVAAISFTACGGDDGNDENDNNDDNYENNNRIDDEGLSVTINDDGTTSNGSIFVRIDENSFYLDYIKYKVSYEALGFSYTCVTGYDKNKIRGVANIPSKIVYRGRTYKIYEIKDFAFSGCESLTSITIPNSVGTINDGTFSGCSGLTSVTIPNNVGRIGCGAFSGCSNLTSITIPNSVTDINRCAFKGCSGLTSVTIGNSVKIIGEGVFDGCHNLISIHLKCTLPPYCAVLGTVDTVFPMFSYATLYVPEGSLSAYQDDAVWSRFKNIVEE